MGNYSEMTCDSDCRIAILNPIRYEPTGALTVRLLLTVAGTRAIESMSCAIEGKVENALLKILLQLT